MKKEKITYRYYRYNGKVLRAKREIPYEVKILSRLMLDELCFKWNQEKMKEAINSAIDRGDKETFIKLSKQYKRYMYE